jgi:hypothetical protein
MSRGDLCYILMVVLSPLLMSTLGVLALVRSLRGSNPHECSLWLVLALLLAPLGLFQLLPLLFGFLRSIGLSPI